MFARGRAQVSYVDLAGQFPFTVTRHFAEYLRAGTREKTLRRATPVSATSLRPAWFRRRKLIAQTVKIAQDRVQKLTELFRGKLGREFVVIAGLIVRISVLGTDSTRDAIDEDFKMAKKRLGWLVHHLSAWSVSKSIIRRSLRSFVNKICNFH